MLLRSAKKKYMYIAFFAIAQKVDILLTDDA